MDEGEGGPQVPKPKFCPSVEEWREDRMVRLESGGALYEGV